MSAPEPAPILEPAVAATRLTRLRQARPGLRVALANGCFDLLHVGHVRYLAGAAAEGDFLVVGINGDDSVRALKGRGRPLLPAADRAGLVAALESVDLVTIFQEPTADELIRQLRPDVHCKGTDYTERDIPERDTVLEMGGRTAVVGDPKEHGTRELIARIRESLP